MPQVIYNSDYGNGVPAMFTSQYYLKLKGKHCRKPHCHNGVVDDILFIFAGCWYTNNSTVITRKAGIIRYCKVMSSSMSRLVAHFQIFRRLMKGKFDAYVL